MCLVLAAMGLIALSYATMALMDVYGQARDATKVATLTQVSRTAIQGLLATRLARGTSLQSNASETPLDDASRSALEANLRTLDAAVARVATLLHDQNLPTLTAPLERLRTAHEAILALRPRLDRGIRLPKAQREASLPADTRTAWQDMLDAFGATADAVDAMIPLSDPVLRRNLTVKRAAWALRMASGEVGNRVQSTLAAGTSWSLAESMTASRELGWMEGAWQRVAENTAGVSDTVRTAIQNAKAHNFEGTTLARRQALFDAFSQHTPPGITLIEVRTRETADQQTIVDLAYVTLDELIARADTLARQAEAALLRNGAALLAALLLVGLGLLAVFRGVLSPIGRMTATMRILADGDVAAEVPFRDSRNEIGAMAAAVQVFKDNLIRTRSLEAEAAEARGAAERRRKAGMHEMAESFQRVIGGVIGRVATSAAELQATAQRMSTVATQTAGQSTTVAAAAEEASSNVGTVAAAAEELGTSVQEIGRQVEGSADLAKAAADEAGRTSTLVLELNGAVARIGDVVGLISSIAGQTNLLALNATIEAARAGAAGRGFAVVASEVKALAEQTAKATDEISQQIGRVQASTGHAVSAIGAITARIQEINGVASSIAAAVEEQGAATQEIVRNVGQAAQGTGEVTRNIVGVAGAAEETGRSAGQVLDAAGALQSQSEHLAAEVARFLDTIRAA